MNDEFVNNAKSRGIDGEAWLKRIPEIVGEYEKKWLFTVLSPFNLTWNYVAPVVCLDGTNAVLKIGFSKDPQFQTEIDALEIFNGEGIEKLLQSDRVNSVILIEHLKPGVPLSSLEDDEEATRILARIVKRLRKPLSPHNKFTTVIEWAEAIPEYLEKYKNTNGPLPFNLVNKANELFKELFASSEEGVLLHGDLHQDNILTSDRDEWLAIDPKGIVAEPAYEIATMIRNPYKKMRDNKNMDKLILKRIEVLSHELLLDPKRIYKWALAQTILSAVWSSESKERKWEHAIHVAEVMDRLKV